MDGQALRDKDKSLSDGKTKDHDSKGLPGGDIMVQIALHPRY